MEGFFRSNITKFDKNDFQVVKDLVWLLENDNTHNESKAVILYDLGEFARNHPHGKM